MRIVFKLITAIFLTLGFHACNKEKNKVDKDEVRILAIEGAPGLSNSPSMRISFEYDQLGRIESASIEGDSIQLTKLYTINYISNQIVMLGHSDTIRMTLDANGNVTKRIWTHHYQYQLGPNNIQFRYTSDTTFSEYNDAGLLSKENYTIWDTSWNNLDVSQTNMSHYAANANYTTANNDVVSIKHVSEIISFNHTASGTSISKQSWEYNYSFGYLKDYENSTDFSNAAILNQLKMYFWSLLPLNEHYAHFPDQMSWSYIERDENGNTISSHNSTFNDEFTYNSYGFLLTRTDPNLPMGKVKFVYDR